jgi:AraC-like DNA-binding protein
MSVFDFFKDVILKYRQNEPSCKTVFEHYFFDLKYYLHPTASIQDFSKLLNISPNQLNHISKVNYDCLFETLLNEHRYKHFLNELESPINSNLTIESIFKLSGFEDNDKFIDFVKSKNNSVLDSHSFNN